MVPFSGVNLPALESRFNKTWLNLRESPSRYSWRISPVGLPLIEACLRESRQGQKSCRRTVNGPSMGFSQIIDTRPQELSADIIVISYRFPGFRAVTVFTSQKRQFRKPFMILFIQMFFGVIAHHIQRIEIMKTGRELRKCRRKGHRPCGLISLYNRGKLFCNCLLYTSRCV